MTTSAQPVDRAKLLEDLRRSRQRLELRELPAFQGILDELAKTADRMRTELLTQPLEPYQQGIRQGALAVLNRLNAMTDQQNVTRAEAALREHALDEAAANGADA